MTYENAWRIMCDCMIKISKKVSGIKRGDSSSETTLFSIPQGEKEIYDYFSNVCRIYKDEITEGYADGAEYIININRICDIHPIYIFVTLFLMMVADAKIYIIYDGSYYDKDSCPSVLNSFLDEFLNTYEKAEKITIVKEMTYSIDRVLEYFLKSQKNIQHIVYFGDFINFSPNAALLCKRDIKIHLPAAHYVILNYSENNISNHDRQILSSFGQKCFNGYIDYAAYVSEDNKHPAHYGFDIDVLYTDLAFFNTLKKFKNHIDKVVTIVFTDKSKTKLNYPEEFYECLDVHFSENYNDNILNYNFNQLFK